jgi:hypothetical protein
MRISDIFEKLGIKGYDDLKEAERKVYKSWESALLKSDVTIEDLKKILPVEIKKAEAELELFENSAQEDLAQKAYLRVLRLLTTIIITPENERKTLEAQLRQRFNL